MPELPEVETIRRDLEAELLGERITRIECRDERFLPNQEAKRWNTTLSGQTVDSFGRKGKYLWLTASNGYRIYLHLRMTGQLIIGQGEVTKALRFRFIFESGKVLALYDQRRFAEGWLLAPHDVWRATNPLGPDALNELDLTHFRQMLKRETKIQPLLLDQRHVAGIGNIYAQEALFKAAIRPTRPSRRISSQESDLLYKVLRETLETAIVHRGSSSRNYTDGKGAKGSAQRLHAVYRKDGEPCQRCRTILKAVQVGGRHSVYCPRCQK